MNAEKQAWFIQTQTVGPKCGRQSEKFVLIAEGFDQAAQTALQMARPNSKVKIEQCFMITESPKRVGA